MTDSGSVSQPHRLAELVGAISIATDVAIGAPMERAIECCLLATRLGQVLGLPVAERSDLYYLSLLSMLGCTGESHESSKLFGDEQAMGSTIGPVVMGSMSEMMRWMLHHLGEGEPLPTRLAMIARVMTSSGQLKRTDQAHCELAQMLTSRLGMGPAVQTGVGAVFERWNGAGSPNKRKGDAIPRIMRIVHVCGDIQTYHAMGGTAAALDVTRKRAGKAFDPEIVAAFQSHSAEVVSALDVPSAWDALLANEPGEPRMAPEDAVDIAASVLADFADMKSGYLSGHSRGVAQLAEDAARLYGFDDAAVRTVRRAGLVHDVGRVTVSAAVWDKAGALTDAEWEKVRLHPYYTERILSRAKALAEPAAVASMHHERLDGSGYHRNADAESISQASRIVAAADAFQTKTEPRPHRSALTPEAAAQALEAEVAAGRLDRAAVRAVLTAAGQEMKRGHAGFPAGLTEREVEVLGLLARGLTMKEIADRLVVSPKTVDAHLQHIYTKIQVRTRSGARLFAMEQGLVHGLPR